MPLVEAGFDVKRDVGLFLFGGEADLSDRVKATIVRVNATLPHRGVPHVAVHDENRVDLIYPDMDTFDDEDTIRVTVDRAGLMTRFGSGDGWEEWDTDDHRDLELLQEAGLDR
ncbi:hypothetical protein [Agromyces humi]|uniref:hypothetical protein n=1 Tax=Agromyces humi TaxID=1766800 RepID=UPI00135AD9FF|nr:hypothetical protein [Agromyces humi]